MNRTTLDAFRAFPAQLEAHYAAVPDEFKRLAGLQWLVGKIESAK